MKRTSTLILNLKNCFHLQNPIPFYPLPLREGDTEPLLDVQTLINELYDEGRANAPCQ